MVASATRLFATAVENTLCIPQVCVSGVYAHHVYAVQELSLKVIAFPSINRNSISHMRTKTFLPTPSNPLDLHPNGVA